MRGKMGNLKFLSKIFLIFFIIIIIVWSLAPIVWTFIISITPPTNIYMRPPNLNIREMNFDNYITIFSGIDKNTEEHDVRVKVFKKALVNSLIVTSFTMLVATILSTITAYSISKFQLIGKRYIFLYIILTMVMPIVVILIPLIRIVGFLGIGDTYFVLILLYSTFLLPITTWTAINYFNTIPKEIEDASYIDGCTPVQTFIRIILPLSKPILGANMIIIFLFSWGFFIIPLIFGSGEAKQVVISIAEFQDKYVTNNDLMAAAGIITVLPPSILTIIFGRFLVGGLARGAIK